MQLVTVSPKYQIVIPKEIRRKMSGIKPGVKVGIHMENQKKATIRTEPENWLERTRGLMANAWKGLDTTKYLNNLRNEWDQKP